MDEVNINFNWLTAVLITPPVPRRYATLNIKLNCVNNYIPIVNKYTYIYKNTHYLGHWVHAPKYFPNLLPRSAVLYESDSSNPEGTAGTIVGDKFCMTFMNVFLIKIVIITYDNIFSHSYITSSSFRIYLFAVPTLGTIVDCTLTVNLLESRAPVKVVVVSSGGSDKVRTQVFVAKLCSVYV